MIHLSNQSLLSDMQSHMNEWEKANQRFEPLHQAVIPQLLVPNSCVGTPETLWHYHLTAIPHSLVPKLQFDNPGGIVNREKNQ